MADTGTQKKPVRARPGTRFRMRTAGGKSFEFSTSGRLSNTEVEGLVAEAKKRENPLGFGSIGNRFPQEPEEPPMEMHIGPHIPRGGRDVVSQRQPAPARPPNFGVVAPPKRAKPKAFPIQPKAPARIQKASRPWWRRLFGI